MIYVITVNGDTQFIKKLKTTVLKIRNSSSKLLKWCKRKFLVQTRAI